MKAAGPIPPHFSADESGQLLIGGYPAEELVAEAGGTPLFVYDNNIVGAQVARFKGAMADGVALHYSVTANPYEPLLEFLGRYVDGFRIVSAGELKRLQQAKLAGIPMNLAGPGKLDSEIEARGQGRRDNQRRKRRRGAPRDPGGRTRRHPAEDRGPRQAAIRDRGRAGDHRRPSKPVRGRRRARAALVLGLIEAGVDWRGLHMFAGAQCLDADGD